MSNIYNDKLTEAIGALGGTPDPEPAGNIYVARLDELISAAGAIGAGQGLPHGTSWPAAPALNEWFARDDLGVIGQWDGARWLGTPEYVPFSLWSGAPPYSAFGHILIAPVSACMVISIDYFIYVSTNNATNYWIVDLYSIGNYTSILLASHNTSLYSSASQRPTSIDVGVLVDGYGLRVTLSKFNSPVSINVSANARIRKVYT